MFVCFCFAFHSLFNGPQYHDTNMSSRSQMYVKSSPPQQDAMVEGTSQFLGKHSTTELNILSSCHLTSAENTVHCLCNRSLSHVQFQNHPSCSKYSRLSFHQKFNFCNIILSLILVQVQLSNLCYNFDLPIPLLCNPYLQQHHQFKIVKV